MMMPNNPTQLVQNLLMGQNNYPPNDPMTLMTNLVKSGGNPMAMLEQMAGQDPRARQAIQMIRGKSPQQIKSIAENMARERGTTLNDIARQLGLNI